MIRASVPPFAQSLRPHLCQSEVVLSRKLRAAIIKMVVPLLVLLFGERPPSSRSFSAFAVPKSAVRIHGLGGSAAVFKGSGAGSGRLERSPITAQDVPA